MSRLSRCPKVMTATGGDPVSKSLKNVLFDGGSDKKELKLLFLIGFFRLRRAIFCAIRQRDEVNRAEPSPMETHRFGYSCIWRLEKR